MEGRKIGVLGSLVFIVLWVVTLPAAAAPQQQPDTKFQISFLPSARGTPVTGRVLLIISRTRTPEPRFQAGDWDNVLVPLFGIDVSLLNPGAPAFIDASTPGFPVRSLRQLPKGDYYIQAVLNVYSECHCSDGHNVWVH